MKIKTLVIAFVLVFVATVLSSALPRHPAYAATTRQTGKVASGSWVWFGAIKVGDGTYIYEPGFDNPRWVDEHSKGCDGSKDYIEVKVGGLPASEIISKASTGDAVLHNYADGGATDSSCYDNVSKIGLGSIGNSQLAFAWKGDNSKIQTYDSGFGNPHPWVFSKNGSKFVLNESSSCKDYITTQPGSTTGSIFWNTDDFDGSDAMAAFEAYLGKKVSKADFTQVSKDGNCTSYRYKNPITIAAGISDAALETGSDAAAGGDAKAEDSCENKGGDLAWIMCPVVNLIDDALNWVDTQIQALLEIDKTSYNNPELKSAWGQMRNIAYIILVPIMLVMVIGTALGFSFIDAYTVKRALPRMVIAILFIALSWEICIFLIEFSNVVGAGVLGPITTPFKVGSQVTLSSLFGGSVLQGILLPFAAIGAIIALWLFGGTLLLMAIIGFMVLLLRQLFVVALLLVSPLAILAWIFPGNDKLWKAWWSLFSKLLIMFPLIMALIGVGRVFAIIIDKGGIGGAGASSLIAQISTVIVWMLPYAFIPLTFRFAGGIFATLTGMVNDRSKGLFDRQKQARADKLQRAGDQNLFKRAPQGSWRSKLNTAAATTMHAKEAGINPLRMRTNMRTALQDGQDARVAKWAQESASFGQWKGDDAKVWAARETTREGIARELANRDAGRFGGEANRARREEAVSQIMRSQREVDNGTFQKARLRAQGSTGTGYQRTVVDADGNEHTIFDSAMMMDDINSVYGSDRNGAGRALAEMRTSLQQSGQMSGAAAFSVWAQQLDSLQRDGSAENHVTAHNAVMDSAIDSATPGQAIYGKPSSAAAMGQAHARRIQAISQGIQSGTHTVDDLSAAVANAAGIADAMNQASPGNGSAFVNELFSQEITVPGMGGSGFVTDSQGNTVPSPNARASTQSIRAFIDGQMGGNQEFVARRSTMSASTLRQAQQQRGLEATASPDPTPTFTP